MENPLLTDYAIAYLYGIMETYCLYDEEYLLLKTWLEKYVKKRKKHTKKEMLQTLKREWSKDEEDEAAWNAFAKFLEE